MIVSLSYNSEFLSLGNHLLTQLSANFYTKHEKHCKNFQSTVYMCCDNVATAKLYLVLVRH
jgi:hypothetical protein